MITIKSQREIELMAKAGHIVALVFEGLKDKIRPGLSTQDIADIAEKIIRDNGAYPTFLNYSGYPGAVCVSINEELVHGIPSKHRILREGDIVSVDVGATLNGYVGDACRTYPVGICSPNALRLIKVTEESFFEGVKHARPGARLGDISHAIQEYCEKNGYSLPREYTGHGIGSHLHEDPYIPNLSNHESEGIILKSGMTLAIEPMFSLGTKEVWLLDDDWGIVTRDGSNSAHFEHTILVTKEGYEILTGE